MSPRNIDAIVYDFGGVLIEINFDWVFERWAALAGVPMQAIKDRFSHGEAYQRHERGEIGLEEYYRGLRAEIGVNLSDTQLTDGWQRVFGPEYPQVIARIKALKGRIPQVLLSNTNFTHYEFFRRRYADALTPLDRIFVSSEMGVRKPEPEAFQWVARGLGVAMDRMLFLDDTQSNLDGAARLGIHTALVRSPTDVERALRPWFG